MARKLKVFRTPIGFHDAYVAAPSRAAALRAWGADVDLFARGVAEQVEDAALMEEPLAHPGEVIRKVRGTMEEHLAALPADPKSKPAAAADASTPTAKPKPARPKPRPSRTRLDQVDQAVELAQQRYDTARRDIANREAALREERHDLEEARQQERDRLERARAKEEANYRQAMEVWRSEQG